MGTTMGISGFSAITPSALTDLSEFIGQPAAVSNVADGDDGEAAFALLYNEALEVSAGQEFEITKENRAALGLKPIPGKSRTTAAISSMGQSTSRIDQPPHSATPPDSADVLDKNRLADWMDAHALARSSHHCAMFCRQGLQAAGLNTEDRPGNAGDYGPFLLRHGARLVPVEGYTPQVGDTVVFDKTEQHPNGHIEMYDGRQWVSDFLQHGFSPYRDAAGTPPFRIYRLS
jgi:antitoxin (DNA-binding transcriptional repressor) of toxin-antitoxin stability system